MTIKIRPREGFSGCKLEAPREDLVKLRDAIDKALVGAEAKTDLYVEIYDEDDVGPGLIEVYDGLSILRSTS